MAEKREKLPRFTTPLATAVYPHLITPDTKFDADGVYKCDVKLTREEAQPFIDELEAIRDKFWDGLVAEDKKLARQYSKESVYTDELDDDGNETGMVIFKTKMKAKVTSKKTKKTYVSEPRLFDAANQRIHPESVYGGSRVRVAGEVKPYKMDSTKKVGVSLRLKDVQIVELVEGGGGGSPFGEVKGGYVAPKKAAFADDGDDDDSGDDGDDPSGY
jgi:hypothetical protein